ncbi:hypothetical protein FQR65_LT10419 [Abscondita terminalis]|nr:hypothetical protein FQR65_LT10419 [Abscondita terminalis]
MSIGVHLDQSVGVMEETRFKKKYVQIIKKLAKESHFTIPEMEVLMLLYYKIQKNGSEKSPGVTKVQLREVLHAGFDMTDVDFTNNVVMSMFRGPSPYVPKETFGKVMSTFLRGNLDDRIKHCFNVYDVMMKGFLRRDTLVRFLTPCFIRGEEDTDDSVKDLADIITNKLDLNRDGQISSEEYKEAIEKDPLLMECLGICLPSRLAAYTILYTTLPKIGKL